MITRDGEEFEGITHTPAFQTMKELPKWSQ